jgi:hypothetical protein
VGHLAHGLLRGLAPRFGNVGPVVVELLRHVLSELGQVDLFGHDALVVQMLASYFLGVVKATLFSRLGSPRVVLDLLLHLHHLLEQLLVVLLLSRGLLLFLDGSGLLFNGILW